MHPLFSWIHAVQARDASQKSALDALRFLQGEHVDLWRRLLLKHHEEYLLGAAAPDRKFRDFRNHVLFPGDGWWGGAEASAQTWYDRTVLALGREDWARAAFAAGVLSHYCTDVFNPLHTGVSPASCNLHRAIERSLVGCYDELFTAAEQSRQATGPALVDGDDWLRRFLRRGAGDARAVLAPLVAGYSFDLGADDPPAALSPSLRRLLAPLVAAAAVGFARVLERALATYRGEPPSVWLGLDLTQAVVTTPWNYVAGRLEAVAEGRRIDRMYDEYKLTGRVETHLTDDVRTVRDLFRREHGAKRNQASGKSRRSTDRPQKRRAA